MDLKSAIYGLHLINKNTLAASIKQVCNLRILYNIIKAIESLLTIEDFRVLEKS